MVPAVVVLGFVLVMSGSRQAVAWWVGQRGSHGDALDWVEREFRPSPAAMDALREVHARHAPLRRELASELERQRQALISRAAGAPLDVEAFRAEAGRWDSLAARSHALTWAYVFEMAALLPEAEGRRFREEMARVVLGLPHAGAAVGGGEGHP
jgi:hypothetical protein